MKEKLLKLCKNKDFLLGSFIFTYVFLLLLGVMIPSLRIGTQGEIRTGTIYRSVIFIIFAIFVVIYAIRKKPEWNKLLLWLVVISLAYLVTNIIAICVPYGDKTSFSTLDKVYAGFFLASLIFTLLTFFMVLPKIVNKNILTVLFIYLTIFVFVCTLYSLITEMDVIIKAFTAKGEDAHYYQVMSFFDNKNSYGLVLFIGIVSVVYLFFISKNKLLIIPLVYFFINLVISRSKTPLVLVLLIALVAFIYWLIKSFKKHIKRNIIVISIIAVLLTLFILIVTVPAIYNSCSFFTNLSNYVREAFFGQAYRSIQDRIRNLSLAGELFATPRIMLGYGEQLVYSYANSCCYRLGYIDNCYIFNLLSGGLVKIILFVYVYVLIFMKVVNVTKRSNKRFMIIMLWCLEISLLGYGLMENFQVLGSNHIAFMFLTFSYLIPVCIDKNIAEVQQNA